MNWFERIKMSSKSLMIFTCVISFCILPSILLSEKPDLDLILERTINKIEKMENEVKDYICTTEIEYTFRIKSYTDEERIKIKGSSYFGDSNKMYFEVRSININGREINQEEIEKVVNNMDKWEKNGINGANNAFPRSQMMREDFNYCFFGERIWNDIAVFKLGFQHKERKEIVGCIWISKSNYNIVYIESEIIVDDMDDRIESLMIYGTYSMIEGYFFLTDFEIRLKLISSLITNVIFNGSLSEYRVNIGLSDEFFKLKKNTIGIAPFFAD